MYSWTNGTKKNMDKVLQYCLMRFEFYITCLFFLFCSAYAIMPTQFHKIEFSWRTAISFVWRRDSRHLVRRPNCLHLHLNLSLLILWYFFGLSGLWNLYDWPNSILVKWHGHCTAGISFVRSRNSPDETWAQLTLHEKGRDHNFLKKAKMQT